MFPIRDHNPSERTPFVTWALIAVNVLVFLSYYPANASNPFALMSFYNEWALVPSEVSRGLEAQTLITSMFLHGDWVHLIFNMIFLWVFGDNIEDLLGHLGYLAFYIASGVAAALVQMVSDPSSTVPVVGASGAIAGVMGGYLLMFPRARVDMLVFLVIFVRVFTLPAWVLLGLWFAMQVVNGAATPASTGGGVAYWAHAGGFIAGAVLLLPVWLRRGAAAWWAETHGAPPHPERSPTAPPPDPFVDGPIRSSRIPRSGHSRTRPRTGPWSGSR